MSRAIADQNESWALIANGGDVSVVANPGLLAVARKGFDRYRPAILGNTAIPSSLLKGLTKTKSVVRLRNPDLWDALCTAILRQVVRASQAAMSYREFCDRFGAKVTIGTRQWASVPRPQIVLELRQSEFEAAGLAFRRRSLCAAAEAYLANPQWPELGAIELIAALQSVPGIGPWTAHVTAVDFLNCWDLYPHDDLAVRTWATRVAPDLHFPHKPDEFESLWREWAGNEVGTLTVITLAAGTGYPDAHG